MLRNPLFRTIAPAALAIALAACNIDDIPSAFGDSATRVASRTAGNPAWGNPAWTMRYAHNGQCDDPRYANANGGRADPGTDEADCAVHGGGLKK